MCGLTGFWDLTRGYSDFLGKAVINSMLACLVHRGPDGQGIWLDAGCGIFLGHRRLSVLELSPLGHQPMHSFSGRYTLIFNGEVYNFRSLRAELRQKECSFRGDSDTEVILAAIETWGLDDALQRFVGMFAMALWDRDNRELYLVRDRLGKKPLYFSKQGDLWWFGSELTSLKFLPGNSRKIDRNVLAAYMDLGFVPGGHSIYESVGKVLPGTYVKLSNHVAREHVYWSASQVVANGLLSPFQGSREEAVCHLETLLLDSVALRLESDVPVGAFLSGGVDSSIVTALMSRVATKVKTFSIGFSSTSFNEAVYAKRVADHLGTDHCELYLSPQNALEIVPRIPSMFDEPFADSSQIATYLVAELARDSVTVALTGDGGDELFWGYGRYSAAQHWQKFQCLPTWLRKAATRWIAWVESKAPHTRLNSKLTRMAQLLESRSANDFFIHFLRSSAKLPLVLEGTPVTTAYQDASLRQKIPNFSAWMGLVDTLCYLPDDILVKVDRTTMAVSLESRAPLLDHRVVEFAASLPHNYKVFEGVSKWPVKQVLYKYVPRELIERPKQGFCVPLGDWLRGPLKSWGSDLLSESTLTQQGFLRPDRVKTLWKHHQEGKADHSKALWHVLAFQEWLRRLDTLGSDYSDCQQPKGHDFVESNE